MNKRIGRLGAMFIGLAVLVLQGCSAPKLTPEQVEARAVTTLNVYPDNRVLVKQEGTYHGTVWAWTGEKNTVVAMALHGQYYNAKDISRIQEEKASGNTKVLAVYLKDGTKVVGTTMYPRGVGPHWHVPAWVTCDTSKKCGAHKTYFYGESGNNFGDKFSSITYELLNNRDHPTRLRTRTLFTSADDAVIKGASAVPKTGRMTVLSGSAVDEFLSQVMASLDERSRRAARLNDEARSESRAEEAAERSAMQKAKSAGVAMCTSTSYVCGDTYSDRTRISCGGFTAEVGMMKADGWAIAGVTPEARPANLGDLCSYSVYHFQFKR